MKAIKMKKIVACLVLLIMLVAPSVYAVSPSEIKVRNDTLSSDWVNWYPSDWYRDTQIDQLAVQLTSGLSAHQEIPQTLHDWICSNIYYDQDALRQGIYSTLSAADVLRERRGVCEGIANLTQALFVGAGIPCIKVWGVAIADGEQWEDTSLDLNRINHTWNEYYMDGCWITVDCTMDMGNQYMNGMYLAAPFQHDYLAPDSAIFADTHLKLQRGFDLPWNIPSDWARGEIETAVIRGLVPLPSLINYADPITEKDFYDLLGLSDGRDEFISRMDAATLLGEFLGFANPDALPYQDIEGASMEQRIALSALYQNEIMHGYNSSFFPSKELSRQEAIVLVVRMNEREEF